jgi:hypothetical protein
MKILKNEKLLKFRLKKTVFINFFVVALILFSISCVQDSMVNNGEISRRILLDPTFENLDKAYYDVELNLLKYQNEKADENMIKAIKVDVKNRKIKSYDEFCERFEKAGKKNFKERFKANLRYSKYQFDMYKKYPEFAENKRKFITFFMANRKHKVSTDDQLEYLSNNKIKTNE